MKFLRYISINIGLLLASFSCIFAMDVSKTTQELSSIELLPSGVWQEIIDSLVIDISKQTEKEIFQNLDNLRLVDKSLYKSVNEYITRTGPKKGKKYYNYSDFKTDIMQDILIKRAKKVVPLGKTTTKAQFEKFREEILNEAIKAEAFNFVKHKLKYDEFFKDNLQKLFLKTFEKENVDLKALEKLLKFGASPDSNIYHMTFVDYITSWRILNPRANGYINNSQQLEILELLLKYGANPNRKAHCLWHSPHGYSSSSTKYPNYPLHRVLNRTENLQNRLNIIKLLLKYGSNPNLKDPSGEKPLDYAKDILKNIQGTVGYYSGLGKENEETRIIKQIIKLLEEEMAKPAKKIDQKME